MVESSSVGISSVSHDCGTDCSKASASSHSTKPAVVAAQGVSATVDGCVHLEWVEVAALVWRWSLHVDRGVLADTVPLSNHGEALSVDH